MNHQTQFFWNAPFSQLISFLEWGMVSHPHPSINTISSCNQFDKRRRPAGIVHIMCALLMESKEDSKVLFSTRVRHTPCGRDYIRCCASEHRSIYVCRQPKLSWWPLDIFSGDPKSSRRRLVLCDPVCTDISFRHAGGERPLYFR